jgi:hypothetical protein
VTFNVVAYDYEVGTSAEGIHHLLGSFDASAHDEGDVDSFARFGYNVLWHRTIGSATSLEIHHFMSEQLASQSCVGYKINVFDRVGFGVTHTRYGSEFPSIDEDIARRDALNAR